MDVYSSEKKAICRVVRSNARQAQFLYQDRLTTRRLADARIFQRLHHQLCERGSFSSCMHVTGLGRSVRTPSLTDYIVRTIFTMWFPQKTFMDPNFDAHGLFIDKCTAHSRTRIFRIFTTIMSDQINGKQTQLFYARSSDVSC